MCCYNRHVWANHNPLTHLYNIISAFKKLQPWSKHMRRATRLTVEKGFFFFLKAAFFTVVVVNVNGILNEVFSLLEQNLEVPVSLWLSINRFHSRYFDFCLQENQKLITLMMYLFHARNQGLGTPNCKPAIVINHTRDFPAILVTAHHFL